MESAILLKTGIQNPSFTDNDWNPVPGNPESTVWNPESKTALNSHTWGDQGANGESRQAYRDERFYYNMEVHQRREILRLFGIEESSTAVSDEDAKQVLVNFLEDKLGIAIAENLEFQTVHRIGKFSNSKGNQGR